jgi:prepilin-type N-terminal cleavage/methylation domain-containing protein
MIKIKNRLGASGGFTLIELLVVIAITAIITVPISRAAVMGITNYYHQLERIELLESGQLVFVKVTKQIRLSSEAVVVNTDDDWIEIDLSGDIYKYELTDDSSRELKEYINDEPDEGNTIAENISVFDVDISVSGDLLTIDLKLTGPKYGEEVDLTTSLFLRNQ